jgi:hypothetical protein
MPDVVPHGGKVTRSVSPPATRGDVSSPFITGAVRTVFFIFATQPATPRPRKLNEAFIKD